MQHINPHINPHACDLLIWNTLSCCAFIDYPFFFKYLGNCCFWEGFLTVLFPCTRLWQKSSLIVNSKALKVINRGKWFNIYLPSQVRFHLEQTNRVIIDQSLYINELDWFERRVAVHITDSGMLYSLVRLSEVFCILGGLWRTCEGWWWRKDNEGK